MMIFGRGLGWAILVVSAACTQEATSATESNAHSGSAAQDELCAGYPEGLACPTLPAPPQLEDGTDVSQWEPSQCPPGSMPDFGTPDCKVIGDPCPEGDWPENVPADNIRYVTPGGTGDGSSKESAAGSIQQVLNSAPAGATIALSKGRFAESITVSTQLHLHGACASQTILEAPSSSSDQVVELTGEGGGSLVNVGVTGPTVGIWVWSASEPMSLRGVVIDGATGVGYLSTGDATVNASMVVIKNTQPLPNGEFGFGFQVSGGSSFTMTDGFIDANRDIGGLVGESGTSVVFEDVVIRNTEASTADGFFGRGLTVRDGASFAFTRGLVAGNRDLGIFLAGLGTSARFLDVVVKDTRAIQADGTYGHGIVLQSGASLIMKRSVLSNNADVGLRLSGQSYASLEDLRVCNTQPEVAGGAGGRGLEVNGGSTLELTRALLCENHELGAIVGQSQTQATMTDIVIRDTLSQVVDGQAGRGLNVQQGASVSLTRALIRGNRDAGVFLAHAGTTLALRDTAIQDTGVAFCEEDPSVNCPYEGRGYGDGVLVLGGARLTLEDFDITNNTRVGLYLYDTTDSGLDYLDGIVGAPSIDVMRGTISGNDYGVNFRRGTVSPSDFTGKEVACFDNIATIDGCYSDIDLQVPSPTAGAAEFGR